MIDISTLPRSELSMAERMALLPEDEREALLGAYSDEEIQTLLWDWTFWGRPEQQWPEEEWDICALIGGRGSGKTRPGAEFARRRAMDGPPSRGAFVAPTPADARDFMIEGVSGILAISPPSEQPLYEPSKRRLTWPNGTQATIFSAAEPEQIRGPGLDWAWCDELAKWKYLQKAWDNLEMTMREGIDPKLWLTTTPRMLKLIAQLMEKKYPATVIVRTYSTYRNAANLAPRFLQRIKARYDGTTLGEQEIYARLIRRVVGALWTPETIDKHRLSETPRQLTRSVIGVDPNATDDNESEDGTECGIVAGALVADGRCPCGRGGQPHAIVTHDVSENLSPDGWGKRVVGLYKSTGADHVTPEANNGGAMVTFVLRTVDSRVPINPVWASRGKHTRAEPVSALYEQGRVHHIGAFPELEDQMCTWVPGNKSPDRMDALVWLLTDLFQLDQDVSQNDYVLVEEGERVEISPF